MGTDRAGSHQAVPQVCLCLGSTRALAEAEGSAKALQLSQGCYLGRMSLLTSWQGVVFASACLQARDSSGLCRRAHSLRLQPTTSVADLCAVIGAADLTLVAAAGAPEVLAEGGCLEKLRSLRYGSLQRGPGGQCAFPSCIAVQHVEGSARQSHATCCPNAACRMLLDIAEPRV